MVEGRSGGQAVRVSFAVPPRPPVERRRRAPAGAAWLPRGRSLSERDAAWRHRIVLVVLVLHLPGLLVVGALAGDPPGRTLLYLVPISLLAGLAAGPFSRRLLSVAAGLGLVSCSAVLVTLLHAVPEAHYHYFVVVAVISLYQDWAVYGLAVGFVLVERLLVDERVSTLHSGPDWVWTLVQVAFVLAESTVLVLFWRADERARDGEQRLQAALWEGQTSVQARLEETERIRTDLIGTVSHEFRTPLTGIRGAALTLLKRGDRLDERGRRQLLEAVIEQQERLSRLLENMLTAARATAADPSAVAEVDAVAAEVAMLAGAVGMGRPPVATVVDPGLSARIDRHALHQVLANLVDNAHQHGTPGSVPLLAAGQDGDEVWVTVSNEGSLVDARAANLLFEPFTQEDATVTRVKEGLGMGLYVVRRLVEVYGGRLVVRAEDGWITIELRLQSAGTGTAAWPGPHAGPDRRRALPGTAPDRAQTPAPTALPTR